MTDGGPRVQATERSFRIIESLQGRDGAGLSELAAAVDLSKSAVYKHVQTLTDLGYLVREGDDYYLSNQFLRLGAHARDRLPTTTIREVITDLSATTGHVASFIANENDRGVYVLRVRPDPETDDVVVQGDPAPLHATAGGKAILAYLPDEERDTVLNEGDFEAHTSKTITDPAALERELRSVRDQRIAFDREEYVEGHQCVASPVVGPEGEPVGAVSVSGLTHQISGKRLEEDITGLVSGAAKTVENQLLSR